MQFEWNPNESPPQIEEHSKAKLAVLCSYLRAYFDRLNVNFARDEFKLDLIDGFAGGGTFRDGGEILSGTPLIMLEESEAAKGRLNQNRTKPLHFDFKHYFVDEKAAHTDHLKKVLNEHGYQVDSEKLIVLNNKFEDSVDDIITKIRHHQPRAGRSLFLLDQTGFSQVNLSLVARIFQKLPAAEVILTFAADSLTNFLTERPAIIQAVAPLGLTEQEVCDLVQLKDGDGGRALVQRALRDKVRSVTGATYDTPFFIRPAQSRRALWFLHLSRHPTARDVMIQCHWNNLNTFEHYGSGDFEMLGWDALKSGQNLRLFHFEEFEAEEMRRKILEAMPAELFSLASEEPITIDTMRHMFANKTAARFSDLDQVVLKLYQEGEIEILNANNKLRSPKLRNFKTHDRISIPKQRRFPFRI